MKSTLRRTPWQEAPVTGRGIKPAGGSGARSPRGARCIGNACSAVIAGWCRIWPCWLPLAPVLLAQQPPFLYLNTLGVKV
jgi:hypothetical protein